MFSIVVVDAIERNVHWVVVDEICSSRVDVDDAVCCENLHLLPLHRDEIDVLDSDRIDVEIDIHFGESGASSVYRVEIDVLYSDYALWLGGCEIHDLQTTKRWVLIHKSFFEL